MHTALCLEVDTFFKLLFLGFDPCWKSRYLLSILNCSWTVDLQVHFGGFSTANHFVGSKVTRKIFSLKDISEPERFLRSSTLMARFSFNARILTEFSSTAAIVEFELWPLDYQLHNLTTTSPPQCFMMFIKFAPIFSQCNRNCFSKIHEFQGSY